MAVLKVLTVAKCLFRRLAIIEELMGADGYVYATVVRVSETEEGISC